MRLGGGAKFDPNGQEYHEAIGAFVWITRNLIHLAQKWNEFKEKKGLNGEEVGNRETYLTRKSSGVEPSD